MSEYSNDVFELYKDYKINADEYKSDEQIKEYIEQFILTYQIYEMLEDNILIGCVIHATKKFNIDTFYIQEIFINEKYRNKKYGTILFNYIIQKCPDELDYISFITKPENIAMFKIAAKYGFELQNTNMSLFICKKK
jgi:N-acetylglutamate synthase-like GNAT family acetyltransferase